MHSCKKWLIAMCCLVFCSICTAVFLWNNHRQMLTFYAQAELYVPKTNISNDHNFIYESYTVLPNPNVSISEHRNGKMDKNMTFSQGTFKMDFDYGPIYIQGSFASSEFKTYWEKTPLEEDWLFTVYLFNTNSGRTFYVNLSVALYADKGMANAILYIYDKNENLYLIKNWFGNIGDEITFNCEL